MIAGPSSSWSTPGPHGEADRATIRGVNPAIHRCALPENPNEVRQYRDANAEIQRAALDEGDSESLIRTLMKELRE